jgi:hypothetical protein
MVSDKDIEDLKEMRRVMKEMRESHQPIQERADKMSRMMAKYLHARGKLPDHLKKYLEN